MKLLFVILDGAGEPGRSALERARTPNLDSIAESGRCGLLYPIKGIAPESDQAVLSLFGYNPFRFYTGRGPLEALGTGIKFKGVAFRGNLSLVRNGFIEEPSTNITESQVSRLCNILDSEIEEARFHHTKGYRFVMVVQGSDRVQNTHPGYMIVRNHVSTATRQRFHARPRKCVPLDRSPKARRTAELVNSVTKRAAEILEGEAANHILLRGAGTTLPRLRKLKGWGMFADSPVDVGLGKLLGMRILEKPNGNKELARAVKRNFRNLNSLYVQIKSPDKFSHRRDFAGKVKALGLIDRHFFSPLMGMKIRFAVTADHSTSSVLGVHTKDPVPLAITSRKPDSVRKYSEKACAKGSLGRIEGHELMKILRK